MTNQVEVESRIQQLEARVREQDAVLLAVWQRLLSRNIAAGLYAVPVGCERFLMIQDSSTAEGRVVIVRDFAPEDVPGK